MGTNLVAGTDEAGRGCLAGPIVAAAVLLDLSRLEGEVPAGMEGLNDSKRVSISHRERLYARILGSAVKVSLVARSPACIDENGLHVTNLDCLATALGRLDPQASGASCLVDGFELDGRAPEHRAVVGGDSTSAAIAAASIIAKVSRDRFMQRAARLYPGWGFDAHVGYSTPEHRAAILSRGLSPIHRRSFNSSAYGQLDLAIAA